MNQDLFTAEMNGVFQRDIWLVTRKVLNDKATYAEIQY
jgi:hypothetical protein